MAIIRTIKSKNYTTINNTFLRDNSISLKAKGLLAYFLSRPNHWDFYTNEICSNCKDKKDSIRAGLKELEEKGYIKRHKKRNEKGKYVGGYMYYVYEIPQLLDDLEMHQEVGDNPKDKLLDKEKEILDGPKSDLPISDIPISEKPMWEKPMSEKPILENPPLISTEYKVSTEYKQNTEAKINTESILSTEVVAVLKENNNNNNIEIGDAATATTGNEDVYKIFIDGGFGNVNNLVKEIIDFHIKEHSKEIFKAALIEAVKNNIYKLSYVEAILNRYKKDGNRTMVNGNYDRGCNEYLDTDNMWQGI